MALKAQKDLELKVHEQFYKNVHMLMQVHPPSRQFKEVFKKDMFTKNNKVGFYLAVDYLLTLLPPCKDVLKKKGPAWAACNARLENEYRTEIMKLVNELNSMYEDANIPQLMTSQLISPGGFKFVKFMFKLSQLVLREQLKQECEPTDVILLPLKPSKSELVTTESLENLRAITAAVEGEVKELQSDFEGKLEAAKTTAQKITKDKLDTAQAIKENKIKVQVLREKIVKEFPDFHGEEAKSVVEAKLTMLKQLKENFTTCEALNSFLGSNDNRLEHTGKLNVPPQISHLIRYEGESLDLSSVLECLNTLIERKRLECKPVGKEELSKQIEQFQLFNERLVSVDVDMKQIGSELTCLLEKLQNEPLDNSEQKEKFKLGNSSASYSDSVSSLALATPLPPSPAMDLL